MINLAWKNIWRNKSRSLIILFAISIGIICGTFFIALYNGLISQRVQNAISTEISNIQIHAPGYLYNRDISDTLPEVDKIEKILDTIPEIRGYSMRFKTMAMISSANNNASIFLTAVDPAQEKTTVDIWKKIKEGEYLSSPKKNSMIIGQKLADKLKLKIRSRVVVTFQNFDGSLVTGAFRITGIFVSGNSSYDGRMAYINKDDLQNLICNSCDLTHEIAISTVNTDKENIVVNNIKRTLPFAEVKTWKELYPEVGMMVEYSKTLQIIFMIIIFLALSFGIINTMLMSVIERTREIGMLIALGMSKLPIFCMITLETILLILPGTVLGIAISFLLISFSASYGIDLSAFSRGLNQMGFSTVIYPIISTVEYIQTVIIIVIIAFLSSLIPVSRAIRINPAEAIRK
jgi:ABC-type lipoprotein release transport system permease subunit